MRPILLIKLISIGLSIPVFGAGSPSTPSVAPEVKDYNNDVSLMLDKEFQKAESQSRKALSRKDKFAEAHNNLAYVLRKQGAGHFEEALKHYNRAIELMPKLPEP